MPSRCRRPTAAGSARDVLHRQVGPAVRRHPRVVESGDVRMLESGQDVALERKALRQVLAPCCRVGVLSATSRLKAPSARCASHTSAMPPAPSGRSNWYGPTRSPARRPLAAGCASLAAGSLGRASPTRLRPRGSSARAAPARDRGARAGSALSQARAPPLGVDDLIEQPTHAPSCCVDSFMIAPPGSRSRAAASRPSPSRAARCAR